MACRMVAARRTARPMQHRTGSVKSPGVGSCVALTKSINGDQQVDLSGRHRRMSQQFLDNSDIRAATQQARRGRVPQRVRRQLLRRPGARSGRPQPHRDRFRPILIGPGRGTRPPPPRHTNRATPQALCRPCLRPPPYVRRDPHRRYPDPPPHDAAARTTKISSRHIARIATTPSTRTAGYRPTQHRQAAKVPMSKPRSARDVVKPCR